MPIDRITFDEGVMGGKPCIRGTPLSVENLLAKLKAGVSREDVLEQHAELEANDLDQCLDYEGLILERFAHVPPTGAPGGAFSVIRDRQRRWCVTTGKQLIGARQACLRSAEWNFLRPLTEQEWQEFADAPGQEVDGRMRAVDSSAVLVCNVFSYWRGLGQLDHIAKALDLPCRCRSLKYEQPRPVMDNPNRNVFKRDPHLDVVMEYSDDAPLVEAGIESKLNEPYRPADPDKGEDRCLRPAYLRQADLWNGIHHTRALAQRVATDKDTYQYLGGAQLLRNILALKHRVRGKRFRLIYLWYRAGTPEDGMHEREMRHFQSVVAQDGIDFRSLAYQDLIARLSAMPGEHTKYLDYLNDRYG